MQRLFLAVMVLLAATLGAGTAVAQYGPSPSWVLTQGVAGSCAGDDISLGGVYVNVLSPASENGVLSAPGFPNLGYTSDTSFTGVGVFGFTAFTAPYSLPANTPLTLSVTTYRMPSFLGGVAYVSYITWDCTTGQVIAMGGEAFGLVIPTLSPAGLMTLTLLLAAVAFLVHRRRKRGGTPVG